MFGFHPALLSGFRLGEWRRSRFHCRRVGMVSGATREDHCRDQWDDKRGNVGGGDGVAHREHPPELLAAEDTRDFRDYLEVHYMPKCGRFAALRCLSELQLPF